MSGGRGTPAHYKDMGSYLLFAWRDAMELAQLLEDEFDLNKTLELFLRLGQPRLHELEQQFSECIGEFIQKTVAQRPAYLRRLRKECKDPRLPEVILLLAIMGQVRVMRLLELRDAYRGAFAPGEGNRATCASLYDFSMAMRDVYELKFPFEVYAAYGGGAALSQDPLEM